MATPFPEDIFGGGGGGNVGFNQGGFAGGGASGGGGGAGEGFQNGPSVSALGDEDAGCLL